MSKPTDKQNEAYQSLLNDKVTYVVFGGAAGGGKSWLGCEWLMQCGHQAPGTRWFIGRNNLSDTRQSVIITWNKVAKEHDFTNEYTTNDHGIKFKNGSEIVFLDLTFYPYKDPMFERLGSKEFTGGWIEEGGEVHALAFDVLKSRIGRHMNDEYNIKSKMLITCNPKKNWLYDQFYIPHSKGELDSTKAFIQSLADQNEYLTEDYREGLDNITDEATKARLKFGDWEYDGDPTTLIDYDAIVDLFRNNHVKIDKSDKVITADVAMQGSDLFVIGVWYGFVLMEIKTMDKSNGKQIIDAIVDMQMRHGVRNSNVIYDADGVGAFVGGDGGFIDGAQAFNNGARPEGKENYENLKTQCYYYLAKSVKAGEMWLKDITETNLKERAKKEFEMIKSRDNDKDGKIKMIAKIEVKKRLGTSPDITDMCAMRMWPNIKPSVGGEIVWTSNEYL